jgi:hypothetical protein
MARKPNYDFEKRRKEQERKAKKDSRREEKRLRREQGGPDGGLEGDAVDVEQGAAEGTDVATRAGGDEAGAS